MQQNSIFLDVGHEFGTRPGAAFGGIQEGPYNRKIMETVQSLWTTRAALEALLDTTLFGVSVLARFNFIKRVSYALITSTDEPKFLWGTYAEKARQVNESGIANSVIQMHLNAAKGKYGLIGFVNDNKYSKDSLEMAKIAADCLEKMSENYGKLLSNVKVVGCTVESTEQSEKNIHFCLRAYKAPAILMEPVFVDNPEHNAFLKSEEGFDAMVSMYVQLLERIGGLCFQS